MSGRTRGGIEGVSFDPAPKSQRCNLTRTSPMMRDKKVDTMRTIVAEKTECACDGAAGANSARPGANVEKVGLESLLPLVLI